MHQVRLLLLLLVAAGCVVPRNSQPAPSEKQGLSEVIIQAQLRRLDMLADTAAKCKALSSDEAKKTWESGFAAAQDAVDKTVGPAIQKAMDAAGDDKSPVWEQIENGYRP